MKVAQGKKGHINWTVAVHDDGTMSLALSANKRKLKQTNNRVYTLVDTHIEIPMPVVVEGVKLKPRLLVKCYLRAGPVEHEKMRWHQMMTLCKT